MKKFTPRYFVALAGSVAAFAALTVGCAKQNSTAPTITPTQSEPKVLGSIDIVRSLTSLSNPLATTVNSKTFHNQIEIKIENDGTFNVSRRYYSFEDANNVEIDFGSTSCKVTLHPKNGKVAYEQKSDFADSAKVEAEAKKIGLFLGDPENVKNLDAAIKSLSYENNSEVREGIKKTGSGSAIFFSKYGTDSIKPITPKL